METEFKTTHNLMFEVADSPYNQLFRTDNHKLFRIGTCTGQWGSTDDSYYILSVVNDIEGNGHLDDVFEWFEHSCKRDNRNLLVLVVVNTVFYDSLINKRGFIALDKEKENVIKIFNKKAYKKLLKNGNEIIKKGVLTCI